MPLSGIEREDFMLKCDGIASEGHYEQCGTFIGLGFTGICGSCKGGKK